MQGHPVGHLHHSQDRTPSFLPAQSCVGAEPTQPQFGSRALTGGGGRPPVSLACLSPSVLEPVHVSSGSCVCLVEAGASVHPQQLGRARGNPVPLADCGSALSGNDS